MPRSCSTAELLAGAAFPIPLHPSGPSLQLKPSPVAQNWRWDLAGVTRTALEARREGEEEIMLLPLPQLVT